jgi:NodT family efflux transporter outer membrane factor (OMF) lipoprotein
MRVNWSMCISLIEMSKAPKLPARTRGRREPTANASSICRLCRPHGRIAAKLAVLVCTSFQTGCMIGPKYNPPSVSTPPAYKELQQSDAPQEGNWKTARPNDAAIRGKWWEAYNDPQLNELEEKLSVSNQNVAAAAANFLAARALVKQSRSQYFPTVGASPSIMTSLPSPAQFGALKTGGSSGSGLTVTSYTAYSLPFDASWEPDFWGSIRNTVRSNLYAAQASAADMENVRLSEEAELAADYFELRGQDSLQQVLDSTVAAYRDDLNLTESQYKAGLSNDEAVAQAETQLRAAEAQDASNGILRAQYEHAIAVLIGQPSSAFSLAPHDLDAKPPEIPVGVPSELLERRPDIASAERAMAQANARIGIARAAFYPNIILTASGGFGNTSVTDWLTWPSRFWSAGPSLAETIFDAGLRRATVQQYRANYDQTVANYRETVLTSFQQVEDNLAALRILAQTIDRQNVAVDAASRNLHEAEIRYKAGVDPYLNVIVAQTALLNDQQVAVNYRMQQMVASVQLIKALGGGWSAAQTPSPKEIEAKSSSGLTLH